MPDREAPGEIRSDSSYTLAEFYLRTGLGRAGLRKARRAKLPVRRFGKLAFILGRDWLAFLESREGQP